MRGWAGLAEDLASLRVELLCAGRVVDSGQGEVVLDGVDLRAVGKIGRGAEHGPLARPRIPRDRRQVTELRSRRHAHRHRAAATHKLSAQFHGVTAMLVGLPIVWEATSQFHLLSPASGALFLGAVGLSGQG